MSVLSIEESWRGDDGSLSSTAEGDGSGTIARKFTVTVDNSGKTVYALTVLAHSGLPQQGHGHPYSPFFICRNVAATRVSPILYEVVATYEAATADPDDNPLNDPPEISYGTTTVDGPVDEDIDGNPIQTVNAEPIKGVTMPFADLTATVTKNIGTFNPFSIYVYVNTVNTTTFMGFPPGTVRCSNISAKKVKGEDFDYFTITVDFAFRKPINTTNARAWWKRVRHEGFKVKETDPFSSEDIYPVARDNGVKVTKPVPLKDDGTRETDLEVGHWLEFEVMRTENHNSMNLGV